jgi:hypothetical protein
MSITTVRPRPRHRWTPGDDLVAIYLSRHGTKALPMMIGGIANTLGMPEGSLVMRMSNFSHPDGPCTTQRNSLGTCVLNLAS